MRETLLGMVYAAGGWAGVESCGMRAKGCVITVLLVDNHSLARRTLQDAADLKVVGEASDGHEAAKPAWPALLAER
jgi:hypothetical protein